MAELDGRVKLRVLFSRPRPAGNHRQRGDPYQFQIERTVAATVRALDLPGLDWSICYQSRATPQKMAGPEHRARDRPGGGGQGGRSGGADRLRVGAFGDFGRVGRGNTATSGWPRGCRAISAPRPRTPTRPLSTAWPRWCAAAVHVVPACAVGPAGVPAPAATGIARMPAPAWRRWPHDAATPSPGDLRLRRRAGGQRRPVQSGSGGGDHPARLADDYGGKLRPVRRPPLVRHPGRGGSQDRRPRATRVGGNAAGSHDHRSVHRIGSNARRPRGLARDNGAGAAVPHRLQLLA